MREKTMRSKPIVFDLDGTLVERDFFQVQLVMEAKRSFLGFLFALALAFMGNKARAKELVSVHKPPIDVMNPRQELLEMAERESQVRKVFVASGASYSNVEYFLRHYPFFSGGFGSSENLNLTGDTKGRFLKTEFESSGFDYVGNSRIDNKLTKYASDTQIISHQSKFFSKNGIRLLIESMRLQHWVKNGLVFLPLFLNFDYLSWESVSRTVLLFLAFGFVTSGNYIINDILDFVQDSKHPTKNKRPIASGEIGIPLGALSAISLIALGLALSQFLLGTLTMSVLLGYLIIAIAYSLKLKSIPILESALLSLMFVLRIVAGGIVNDFDQSEWLFNFTWTFFFSLALLKRWIELTNGMSGEKFGRAYRPEDANIALVMGISSSVASMSIFLTYTATVQAQAIFSQPELLLALGPFQILLVSRLWLAGARNEIQHDPVKFVLRDKMSLLLLCSSAVIAFFAKLGIW